MRKITIILIKTKSLLFEFGYLLKVKKLNKYISLEIPYFFIKTKW